MRAGHKLAPTMRTSRSGTLREYEEPILLDERQEEPGVPRDPPDLRGYAEAEVPLWRGSHAEAEGGSSRSRTTSAA